jgi:hypothetical protein
VSNSSGETHLNRTPELTGDGVRCLVGLLTVYSLMGGKRFGKSGILFWNAEEQNGKLMSERQGERHSSDDSL